MGQVFQCLAVFYCCASAVLAAPGDLRWSVGVQGEAWANPTVAPDGTIYLATHHTGGVLYAISPTGSILRQRYTPGTVEHSPALDPSSNLYLVTLFGALAPGNTNPSGPWIISYDSTDFAQRWRTRLANGSDNSPWFGPSNKLYTGLVADPRSPTATNGQHMYRFDATTGATQMDLRVTGWIATPGVVDEAGRVFFGAEDITGSPATPTSNVWPGVFYALDGNNATQWPAFTSPGGDFGSPVSSVGGIVYTTCRDKNLYGFRATDGEIVFQRQLAGRSWTGCTIGIHTNNGNFVLYTGTQGTNEGSGLGVLYAIEIDGTSTGRVLWTMSVAPMTFGHVALDNRGNLYYTTSVGELQARDAAGALLWSTNCGAGAGGPTILDDGTIVVASEDNKVLAFEGNGDHLADNAPWPKYKRNLRNTSYVLDPVRDLPAGGRMEFVVHSEGGTPFPWAGTNYYPTGTVIWAQAPEWKNRGTQYVCVGWTDGMGDIPASGATNRLSFSLTTDSSLRWLWTTNYPTTSSGTPHWWLIHHGLSTNDASSTDDPDEDAWLTREEYLSDTDPTNGASYFDPGWDSSDPSSPLVTIAWSSTQRLYSVEHCSNLIEGAWISLHAPQPGTDAALGIALTNTEPFTAYRIGVQPP